MRSFGHDAREETNHLADLLRREHMAMAEFLVVLAEFHRERRWVELGYRSLFYFLVHELGLSKGAAFYRNVSPRRRARSSRPPKFRFIRPTSAMPTRQSQVGSPSPRRLAPALSRRRSSRSQRTSAEST